MPTDPGFGQGSLRQWTSQRNRPWVRRAPRASARIARHASCHTGANWIWLIDDKEGMAAGPASRRSCRRGIGQRGSRHADDRGDRAGSPHAGRRMNDVADNLALGPAPTWLFAARQRRRRWRWLIDLRHPAYPGRRADRCRARAPAHSCAAPLGRLSQISCCSRFAAALAGMSVRWPSATS